MAAKNTESVAVRVQVGYRDKLTALAEKNSCTQGGLMQLLIDGLENGEIMIEDGKIKAEAPILEDLDKAFEYEELGFGRVLRAMRDNRYPDHIIQSQNEMLVDGILSRGEYKPRRGSDYGA